MGFWHHNIDHSNNLMNNHPKFGRCFVGHIFAYITIKFSYMVYTVIIRCLIWNVNNTQQKETSALLSQWQFTFCYQLKYRIELWCCYEDFRIFRAECVFRLVLKYKYSNTPFCAEYLYSFQAAFPQSIIWFAYRRGT